MSFLVFLTCFAVVTISVNTLAFRSRRTYRVPNPTSITASDYDLLLSLDTKAMIASSQLRSDCGDLLFTRTLSDSPTEAEAMEYWIESGCNTNSTQVWIQWGFLSDTMSEFYVFHGHSSYVGTELPFTGRFHFFNYREESCSEGWTRTSLSFDLRYPYGGGEFGRMGGSSSHSHYLEGSVLLNDSSSYFEVVADTPSSGVGVLHPDHTHQIFGRSSGGTSSKFNGWVSVLCTPYTFSIRRDGQFPVGTVFLSTVDFSRNNTETIRRASEYDDHVPFFDDQFGVGYSRAGSTGHTHGIWGFVSETGKSPTLYCLEDSGAAKVATWDHTHEVYGFADYSTSLPPHVKFVFNELITNRHLPQGAISIATEEPPLGWEYRWDLDSVFPMGSPTHVPGTMGDNTHAHSFTIPSENGNKFVECDTGGVLKASSGGTGPSGHVHSLEGETDWVSNLPSYVETPFYQKKISLDVDGPFNEMHYSWMCYGVKNSATANVCEGSGSCEGQDICVCDADFYGPKCEEKIDGLAREEPKDEGNWKQSDFVVVVSYETRISIIQNQGLEGEFDCSRIGIRPLLDVKKNATCFWRLAGFHSSHLVVDLEGIFSEEFSLEVRPITDPEQLVNVTVLPWTRTLSAAEEFLGDYWYVLVILAAVACTITLSGLVTVVVLIVRNRKDRKIAKIVEGVEVEEVKTMIEESKASRDSRLLPGHGAVRFNSELFSVPRSEITLIRELGRGGSGAVVYSATWTNGREVAFKVFTLLGKNNIELIEREVELMAALQHPSILRFWGACVEKNRLGLILELCMTDLKQYLETNLIVSLDIKLGWMREIAEAMQFLHSRNVIHRDLKCENVLLSKELQCKLIDFGLSRHFNDPDLSKTKAIGTSIYMAPEMILGLDYSSKVDVFSFGIAIWIIYTQQLNPYEAIDSVEFRVANDPTYRPDLDAIHEESLKRLAAQCWNHSEADRPSFDEILTSLRTQSFQEEVSKTNSNQTRVVYARIEGQAAEDAEDIGVFGSDITMPDLQKSVLSSLSGVERISKVFVETGGSNGLTEVGTDEDLRRRVVCEGGDLMVVIRPENLRRRPPRPPPSRGPSLSRMKGAQVTGSHVRAAPSFRKRPPPPPPPRGERGE